MHSCRAYNHNRIARMMPACAPDGAGDGGLPAPLRQGRPPVTR